MFVRTPQLVTRARAAIAGLAGAAEMTTAPMSLAKGLEFRAVVVMACDEGVLPLDERVADAADEAELDDIYETERRLLYVACTRAREHLLLTGVAPTSEYLADFTSDRADRDAAPPPRRELPAPRVRVRTGVRRDGFGIAREASGARRGDPRCPDRPELTKRPSDTHKGTN